MELMESGKDTTTNSLFFFFLWEMLFLDTVGEMLPSAC